MAIRETFRRALRRSDESSTSSQTDSGLNSTTTSSQSSEPSSLHKTLSNWSWTSNKEKAEERKKEKSKKRIVHPSQRPLTQQNLAHQELLSHFTMAFGASNPEQIVPDDFAGISPCCTRTPSLVGDESSDGSATPRSCADD